jgi:hypothetical protein
MPVDPMESAWHKFSWARRHKQATYDVIGEALHPNVDALPFQVEVNEGAEFATAVVRLGRVPTFRIECGLALGDALQNYRASLDHLAWTLVTLTGRKMTRREERSVYFPMATSRREFENRVNRWLPGVPATQRAVVRRYQPYRRDEHAKALRLLNRLSNVDKHRALVPTVVNATMAHVTLISNWQLLSFETVLRDRRAVYEGTRAIEAVLARTGPTPCGVQVEGALSVYPSLGRGIRVPDALEGIEATVSEVLSTFSEML